jgi:hypothetical protein
MKYLLCKVFQKVIVVEVVLVVVKEVCRVIIKKCGKDCYLVLFSLSCFLFPPLCSTWKPLSTNCAVIIERERSS